jgi:hypothetical protein
MSVRRSGIVIGSFQRANDLAYSFSFAVSFSASVIHW